MKPQKPSDLPTNPDASRVDLSSVFGRGHRPLDWEPVKSEGPEPSPADQEALIERARAGDQAAFGELLSLVHSEVACKAEQILGARGGPLLRPSDVTQGGYLRAIACLHAFRGRTLREFLAWIGSILESTIRDHQKYEKARKRQVSKHRQRLSTSQVSSKLPSPNSSIESRESNEDLERALARLRPDYRMVLHLSLVEERPIRDLSRIVGRSEGAVRVLLHRARAALAVEISRVRP